MKKMEKLKYYYTKKIGGLDYNSQKVNLLKYNDTDVYYTFESKGYYDATVRVRAFDENGLPLTGAAITMLSEGHIITNPATLASGVPFDVSVTCQGYFSESETGVTSAGTFYDFKFNLVKEQYVNYTTTNNRTIAVSSPFDIPLSGNVYSENTGSFLLSKLPTAINHEVFRNQTTLQTIDLPDTLTQIGREVFKGCTALKSIVIPNGVTTMGISTFEGCTGMTDATLGKSLITLPKNAFSGCTSLSGVNFGRGVLILNDSSFAGCTALTSVTIPNNVYKINAAVFSGDTNLKSITCLALRAPDILPNTFGSIASDGILYTLRGSFDYDKWMKQLAPLGWTHQEIDD